MRMDKLNSVCAEVNVNILALIPPSAERLERPMAANHVHPEACLRWSTDANRYPEPEIIR